MRLGFVEFDSLLYYVLEHVKHLKALQEAIYKICKYKERKKKVPVINLLSHFIRQGSRFYKQLLYCPLKCDVRNIACGKFTASLC